MDDYISSIFNKLERLIDDNIIEEIIEEIIDNEKKYLFVVCMKSGKTFNVEMTQNISIIQIYQDFVKRSKFGFMEIDNHIIKVSEIEAIWKESD